MDPYFALEPDAPELRVGMGLFRFSPIPSHDRISGVDSLKDAAIDIGDIGVFLPEQSYRNTYTAVLHRTVDYHWCVCSNSSQLS
jgi:hypothetical protein